MHTTLHLFEALSGMILKILLILSLGLSSPVSSFAKSINAESNGAILTSIADSLGNVNTNSYQKGDWNWSCDPNCPDLQLNTGETITITAQGSDPNNRPLEYQFLIQKPGGGLELEQDWSANNQFVWHISNEYYGRWIVVQVSVRNDDGVDDLDVFCDDYTFAGYEVLSEGHPYANLAYITDSLGNVNTNSENRNTTYWSCDPNCSRLAVKPGEQITISAYGSANSPGPFEYSFTILYRSGGLSVLQDWSAENTYTWTVPNDRINPPVGIYASIRNMDGLDYYGSLMGDDYSAAWYQVLFERIYLPVIR